MSADKKQSMAQATLEFTFAMIAVMFLIYGMVKIFHWAGMDLAQRRVAQDASMSLASSSADPAEQLSTEINSVIPPMAAVYHGTLTNGNVSQ